MFALKLRLFILTALLFAIIYAVVVMVGTYLGLANFYFYLFVSLAMMSIQYMLGPKLVEWTMRVKYARETKR